MERDELVKVFYGEGAVPTVWATDCPVRFDVWYEFAKPPAPGDDGREDVILAINEEHGTRRVLDHFHNLQMWQCNPIAAGSFISAEMTLAELVRAVLPMTNLASLVKLAQDLLPPPGSVLVDVEQIVPPGWVEPGPSTERRLERAGHLEWFIRLLTAVVAGSDGPPPKSTGPKSRGKPNPAAPEIPTPLQRAATLLRDAVVEAELTAMPGDPRSQVIDRRRRYPVVSVTTNRRASPAVTRSRVTVKADAAEQLFSVDCSTIGWAVIDSGIDAAHSAFRDWWPGPGDVSQRGPCRVVRAFNFVGARATLSADATENGLVDWTRALPYLEIQLPETPAPTLQTSGPLPAPYTAPVDSHGTHVAGIIGGSWPERKFRGICPSIRLYDFRVLDAQGKGDEFSIVTALQAIRHINDQAGRTVIAGVNISLSVPHDVATHSCGWTPVCIECDRLTRSGVVVVTAAGNSGYTGVMKTSGVGYNTVSISDPGNTDAVITVGSTHRSDPHRHGVSYFSSRGPTADGRAKPDILAPGEDIDGPVPNEGLAAMHGTSQAAAHVSGAAAMLVARYRELLGRPERVKEILCGTATDLGRERDFQGSGLVDVLRAMQSI